MENVLSMEQIVEALAAELESINWIKEIKSHESIRLKADESNEEKSVVDGISIEIYGDKSGYLMSLLIENSQSDGACSITAYELDLEEEVEFKSVEEVKTYFAKEFLPKLLHLYFSETSEVIIRQAIDEIKESEKEINWGSSYINVGKYETGCILTINGDIFNFSYPYTNDVETLKFVFIARENVFVLDADSLAVRFDELVDLVKNKVAECVK